jgi:hypothetical protein
VPAKVIQVQEIPYTINMKKVELAVRNVIHGQPVTNRDALANPGCLTAIRRPGRIEPIALAGPGWASVRDLGNPRARFPCGASN